MWKKITSKPENDLTVNSMCPHCGRGIILPDEQHPGWVWCRNCGAAEEAR